MTEVPEYLFKRSAQARRAAEGRSTDRRRRQPGPRPEPNASIKPDEVLPPEPEPASRPNQGWRFEEDQRATGTAPRPEAPTDPIDFRTVALGRKRFLPAIVGEALIGIPIAFAAGFLVWFLFSIIISVTSWSLLGTVRGIYIGMMAVSLPYILVSRASMFWYALKRRVPYRTVFVAFQIYRLDKRPNYRKWSREEFMRQVESEYRSRELGAILMRSMISNLFRRPSAS